MIMNCTPITIHKLSAEDIEHIRAEGISFKEFMHDSDDHFLCEMSGQYYAMEDLSLEARDHGGWVCLECEDDYLESVSHDEKTEHGTHHHVFHGTG